MADVKRQEGITDVEARDGPNGWDWDDNGRTGSNADQWKIPQQVKRLAKNIPSSAWTNGSKFFRFPSYGTNYCP